MLLLLMPFLASVMAKRSPLLHSIGSSRMAAGRKSKKESGGLKKKNIMKKKKASLLITGFPNKGELGLFIWHKLGLLKRL